MPVVMIKSSFPRCGMLQPPPFKAQKSTLNVDVDNRFTVYGIRDLVTELSPITMLANSEFVALLKQANTDSSKMAEVIGVSEAQLRFVTNTASGMGLIKCGSVVIPFDNQISKDTDLYRLYNTNIHEKIAEQKKKEAMLADLKF